MQALQSAMGGMPDGGEPAPDSMDQPIGEGGDPIGELVSHAEEVLPMVAPEQQEKLSQAISLLQEAMGAGPMDDVSPAAPGMESGGDVPSF